MKGKPEVIQRRKVRSQSVFDSSAATEMLQPCVFFEGDLSL